MTHLDDRQLRDKLAKASSDMPHVDLWPHLHKEAAAISEAAQRRRRGAGFSPFTATRLLAPAFALLLVLGASLTSLQGHEQRIADGSPTPVATRVDVVSDAAASERSAAVERRMAAAEERVREAFKGVYLSPGAATSASGTLSDLDAIRLATREIRREMGVRMPATPPLLIRFGPQAD